MATPGGRLSSNGTFGVAPTIMNFSPVSGLADTSVTIAGANLTGLRGYLSGTWRRASHLNSGTEITATVPSGAKSGYVVVITLAGSRLA